jgi:hypothetical protein
MAPDESWVVLADGDRRSRCVVLARQSLGAPRGVFGAETLTPEDGTAGEGAEERDRMMDEIRPILEEKGYSCEDLVLTPGRL